MMHNRVFTIGLIALAVCGLAACTTTDAAPRTSASVARPPGPAVSILTEPDLSQITAQRSAEVQLAGQAMTATSYSNAAYECARGGSYPFVVLSPEGVADAEPRPLWVMLHGGGSGYFAPSGDYVGTERWLTPEAAGVLLDMPKRLVGADGTSDTFIGDRLRAGDRVAIGSLCDHDLYLGLGQPYPNAPGGGTVDGLLANLSMLSFVEGKYAVSERWIIGTSAGSIGAYALAENLWERGTPVSGVILDSGLYSDRSITLRAEGGKDAHSTQSAAAEMIDKHGPYLADAALRAPNAIARGFDTPLFATVQTGDSACGGQRPAVPSARAAGFENNCEWVFDELAGAAARARTSGVQWVRTYPGNVHTASDLPGTPLQAELRAWYEAVCGRASTA